MAAKMLKSHLGTQSKGREKMKFEFQWTVVGAGSLPVKEGTKVTVQWKRGSAKKAGATAVAVVDGQHSASWGEQFSVKVTMMSDPLTNNFDRKPLSFSLKDEKKKRTIARLSINLGDHVHRTASQSVSFPLVLSSSYSAIKDAAPPTLSLVWYSNLLQVGNRKTQRLQVPAAPSAVAHLRKGLVENKRSSRIIGTQEFVLADEVDTSDPSETSVDGASDEEDVTEFVADESIVDDSVKTGVEDLSDKEESEHDDKEDKSDEAEAPNESASEKENSQETSDNDKKEDVDEKEESKSEKSGEEKDDHDKSDSEKEESDKEASESKGDAEQEKREIIGSLDGDDIETVEESDAKEADGSTSSDDECVAPPQITISGEEEEKKETEKKETEREEEKKEKQEEEKEETEEEGSKSRESSRKKKERKSRSISESDEARAERKKKKEKKERRKTGDEEGGDEEATEPKEKSRERQRDSSSSRHKSKSRKIGRSKEGDTAEEESGPSLSSISEEVAAHAKEVEEMKKSKSKNKHLMRSVVEEAAAKASKRSPKSSVSSKTVKASLASDGGAGKKHKHARKSMDEVALRGLETTEVGGGSSTNKSMIPGLDLGSKVKSVLSGTSGKKGVSALTERDRDGSKERQRGLGGSGPADSSSSASATAQAAVGSLWEGLNRVGRALPGPISTDAHKKETGQVMLSMANEVQELKDRIGELEAEQEQLLATLAGKEKTAGLLQDQIKEMAQTILRFEQAEQRRVMEERLRIAAQQEVAVRANTRRTRSTDLAVLLDPVAASKRRGYLYVLRMIVLILVLLLLREIF